MAGNEIGKLFYDIDADDSKLKKALDNSDSRVSKLGHTMADVGKKIALGLAVAGAGAVAFGVSAVKAYSEAQDAVEQTRAVLKSTGNAAGVTAAQVTDLASKYQRLTKFSDETIRSGENLLLTFTNIGSDIFPQATETMLNMSQALGQDMKSSAIQLGKALQDPILGVTALRRVGVNFTEKQQEVIKGLVDTGHAAEAQKLILKELGTEFGNSAVAAGQTFSGKLAILKNSLNDVQETIGFVIVDALTPFATRLADIITKIDWQAVIDRTIMALKTLWHDYIVPIAMAIYDMATQVWNFLQPSLLALWNNIQQNLIPTLMNLWHQVIEPLMPVLGVMLVASVWLVINALNILIGVVTSVINFFMRHKDITIALTIALGPLALAFLAVKAAMAFQAVISGINAAFLITTGRVTALTGALGTLSVVSIAGWAALVVADLYLVRNAANAVKAAFDAVANSEIAAANLAPEGQMRTLQQQATAARAAGDWAEVTRISNALKALGGNAAGTNNWRGGLTWVGERGPEIVNLPRGSQVIPNHRVSEVMGGNQTVFNIGEIHNEQDENWVMRRINRDQQLESMGLSPMGA